MNTFSSWPTALTCEFDHRQDEPPYDIKLKGRFFGKLSPGHTDKHTVDRLNYTVGQQGIARNLAIANRSRDSRMARWKSRSDEWNVNVRAIRRR